MEEDRYTRITLRIPKELHAKLQQSSDATSKSINAEIVGRLEQTFAIDGKPEMSVLERWKDEILSAFSQALDKGIPAGSAEAEFVLEKSSQGSSDSEDPLLVNATPTTPRRRTRHDRTKT